MTYKQTKKDRKELTDALGHMTCRIDMNDAEKKRLQEVSDTAYRHRQNDKKTSALFLAELESGLCYDYILNLTYLISQYFLCVQGIRKVYAVPTLTRAYEKLSAFKCEAIRDGDVERFEMQLEELRTLRWVYEKGEIEHMRSILRCEVYFQKFRK